MKVVVIAMLSIASLGAGFAHAQNGQPPEHTIIERDGEAAIVTYSGADPAMNGAIAAARAKLSYFWAHVASPAKYEDGFTLKVAFPTKGKNVPNREHIWVDAVERTATGFRGNLANEPEWMPGQHLGDQVAFSDAMISDWGFERRGKLIGYYTIRVMLAEMPEDEAAEMRAMLGKNPQ